MKVYISVDMEGGTGVASAKHMADAGYTRMCKLLTQEVNAAIAGAFEAGATEVLVNDAHGSMTNILRSWMSAQSSSAAAISGFARWKA